MWRLWRITAILLGFVLVSFSAVLYVLRPADSSFYLLMGKQTIASNTQHYIYAPDGTPVVPIEGTAYYGDFPFFDLTWRPDGSGFFERNYATNAVSIVSIDGHQRRVIDGLSYNNIYSMPVPFFPHADAVAFFAGTPALFGVEPTLEISVIQPGKKQHHRFVLPDLDVGFVPPIFWSSDGRWLYLRICQMQADRLCALYQVRPTGTDWTRLSGFFLYDDLLEIKASPDGEKVAFLHNHQVWIVPPDPNATGGAFPAQPVFYGELFGGNVPLLWSADSEWIIYQPNNTSIFRLRPDGTDINEVLASDPAVMRIEMIFVDEDDWVYYWKTDVNATDAPDIYRISILGGEPQLVMANALRNEYLLNQPIFTEDSWLIVPQLQPDHTPDLYRMRRDGAERELLFDTEADYAYGEFTFMLAPDEQWLLIGNDGFAGDIDLRVNIDNGLIQAFTNPDPTISQTIFMNPSPLISIPYRAGITAIIGIGLILISMLRLPPRNLRRSP